MGEIKEYRKKHFTGLDADLASVVGMNVGDTYLSTDKKKLYYWNGTAWKTGLGYEFVSRNAATGDVRINTLTRDNAWHYNAIDLSAIVPAGAIAVMIGFDSESGSANQNCVIAGDGQAYPYDAITNKTQVANVKIRAEGKTFIDTNRLIDYLFQAADTDGWITVKGWFI